MFRYHRRALRNVTYSRYHSRSQWTGFEQAEQADHLGVRTPYASFVPRSWVGGSLPESFIAASDAGVAFCGRTQYSKHSACSMSQGPGVAKHRFWTTHDSEEYKARSVGSKLT